VPQCTLPPLDDRPFFVVVYRGVVPPYAVPAGAELKLYDVANPAAWAELSAKGYGGWVAPVGVPCCLTVDAGGHILNGPVRLAVPVVSPPVMYYQPSFDVNCVGGS
jgi:hypothetical protein